MAVPWVMDSKRTERLFKDAVPPGLTPDSRSVPEPCASKVMPSEPTWVISNFGKPNRPETGTVTGFETAISHLPS